jgi:hypothetical protein
MNQDPCVKEEIPTVLFSKFGSCDEKRQQKKLTSCVTLPLSKVLSGARNMKTNFKRFFNFKRLFVHIF